MNALMAVFARMRIAQRLMLSHGLLLFLIVLVAAWSMSEFRAFGERMRQIVEVTNAKVTRTQDMLNAINEMALRARSIALLSDGDAIEEEVKGLKVAMERYQDATQEFEALAPSEGKELQLWKSIAERARQAEPLLLTAAEQGQKGSIIDATMTLTVKVASIEQAWRSEVFELIALKSAQNADAVLRANEAESRAQVVVLLLVLVAGVSGAGLAWRIARSVALPVQQAITAAERIASGDLSTPLPEAGADDVGRLLQAMIEMQAQLSLLVSGIRDCATSIQEASTEVASGNQDLSARTEMTAKGLQSAAVSLEQITSQVGSSAASARHANQQAEQAASLAKQGSELVALVASTMYEIQTSSQRIAEITGVINGIATQTNLLALNASVEAARAGAHGRGFSVVADEVRALAQRCANAAKEIGALIGVSSEQVSEGAQRAASAGDAMNNLVTEATGVATALNHIQLAMVDQSKEITQVNMTVGQLDGLTQQNAALVEESAASAESLHAQSQRMVSLISVFR